MVHNVECKHRYYNRTKLKDMNYKKQPNIEISTKDNGVLHIVIGRTYGYKWNENSTFEGKLTKYDQETNGALLMNKEGIIVAQLNELYAL